MSVLTDKQKHDLNESIMEYLHAQGLHTTYAAMRTELASDHQPNPKSKFSDLLEKKWTAVIRLQKKVRELEDRNAMLQEELNAAPARRANTETDWVPRAPARYTFTGHRSPVTSVAFHPLFTLVASASEDATIKIWDWETGEFERTLKGHTKQVWGVDFGSTGENLASCSSDATIKLWSTADWDKANYSGRTLRGHEHTVSSVKFMPGDEEIVSASRDTTIRIWNVASAYCVRTLRGHDNWVRMCVPSSDGALLASCSNDYTAQIWDPKSGNSKMVFRGHDHNVEGVTFAPICAYPALCELAGILSVPKSPGAFIATASRDKTIRLWDVVSGQELRVLAGHNDWVRSVVFHPNGKFLLSASDDKTIRVWELSTGRCVKVVEAHTHFVSSIAWGPAVKTGDAKDGEKEPAKFRNVVASGSVDQSVRIWLP